jgi:hypothetical protein
MTQQFHDGQEVECATQFTPDHCFGPELGTWEWRKAKIVKLQNFDIRYPWEDQYLVQFPDGTRAVFDVEHIRLSKEQIEQELIKNGERFLDAMGDEVKP